MTNHASQFPSDPSITYRALPSGTVLFVGNRPVRVFDDGALADAQRRYALSPELCESARRRIQETLLREVGLLIGLRVSLLRPLRVMTNGIATAPCEFGP